MKRILSFLLCIVLLKAQAFAIHGNLEGTDSGTFITGTYSGTLIPEDADQGTRVFNFTTGEQTGTMNSIGLFSLGMPDSGIGQGGFLIFTDGISYVGSITGVGDPGAGAITAVLEATYDYVDFVRDASGNPVLSRDATTGAVTPVTANYTAAVRGSLSAEVISSLSSINALSAAQGNYGRISGSAETGSLYVGPNGGGELVTDKVVRYKVDGVKQSILANTANPFSAADTATTTNLSLLDLLLL